MWSALPQGVFIGSLPLFRHTRPKPGCRCSGGFAQCVTRVRQFRLAYQLAVTVATSVTGRNVQV